MLQPFEGPRLKVRRAATHITKLQELLNDWAKTAKMQRYLAGETETHRSYRFRFIEPLPVLGAVPLIGDAIHNTRSSLDILLCDIARLNKKSTAKVLFPFALDESALRSRLARTPFPRLGPDVCAAILECKPYKEGGNPILRQLHDLDTLDKHELIIPVAGMMVTEISGMDVVNAMFQNAGLPFRLPTRTFVHEGNIEQIAKNFGAEINLDPNGGGPVDLHFPENTDPDYPRFPVRVVPRLMQFAKLAQQIIERFASKFGAGNGPA